MLDLHVLSHWDLKGTMLRSLCNAGARPKEKTCWVHKKRKKKNQLFHSQVYEQCPVPQCELSLLLELRLQRGTKQNGKIVFWPVLNVSQPCQPILDHKILSLWKQLGKEIRNLHNKECSGPGPDQLASKPRAGIESSGLCCLQRLLVGS